MKKSILIPAAIAVIIGAAVACSRISGKNTSAATPAATDQSARIKRGEYLVNAIGCDDCHSPKRMGAQGPELIPELRFSGHPKNAPLPPASKDAAQKGWMLFTPT